MVGTCCDHSSHTRYSHSHPAQALATPIRFCALTLARLPSHFLLPFATTLEKLPATTNAQSPKLKARIKPGRPADFTENTLAQTSYVLNRQDLVRHLSRKKHWVSLISERQKEKFAGIAHRSPSASGLVKDDWIWEDQVDAAIAMLEKEVVDAIRSAVKTRGKDKCSSSSAKGESAFALAFDRDEASDGGIGAHVETGLQAYMLTSLLSPGSLDILRRELAQDSTGMVYISKSSEAYQVQLAIDRLKIFNDCNEIQKELPQVQNPPGTRAARLKREEEEREALLSEQDEVNDRV